MAGYHIELHGKLSELTNSESVDIDIGADEVYGEELKAQVAVVLGAKNPQQADTIRQSVDSAVWTTSSSILGDDAKLRQGHYGLRPKARQ